MARNKQSALARKKKPAASQEIVADDVTITSDVAAIAPYFTPPANGNCPILNLIPFEIKLRIWTLAVTVDEPIEPHQLCPRSNKFLWSKYQFRMNCYRVCVGVAEQLAFVQLSKVSKELYNAVAGSHLFYKVNTFKFTDNMTTINYLVAITSNRLNAIRSIEINIPPRYASKIPEMFAAIAACKNLQSLKLNLDGYYTWNNEPISKVKGHKELLLAVQGLAHVKVNLVPCPNFSNVNPYWYSGGNAEERKKKAEKDRDVLEYVLQAEQTTIRGKNFPREKFIQAQLVADLDIHGDGRLGEDKKPGIVASRTRQQLRNIDKIKADGTVPKRPVEKFDLNGELAWCIYMVHNSRQVDDSENQTVEFSITCSSGLNSWSTISEREELIKVIEQSWEDVTVLTGAQARYKIVDFYETNPWADGKQLVLDAWKSHAAQAEDPDASTARSMSVRDKRSTERRLQAVIRRQEVADRRESENAARAARAAAAIAAKAGKKASTAVKSRDATKTGTASNAVNVVKNRKASIASKSGKATRSSTAS